MRIAIGLLSATLLLAGCVFHHKSEPNPAPAPASQPKAVVKPDLRVFGQVAMVNAEARFVVITFPAGSVPPPERRMNVYRGGLKVGEVKVTGPQRENETVADIIAGDVQPHDEIREQ
jgi:PBP1b-binding outer membrane lipoprotein LpoB